MWFAGKQIYEGTAFPLLDRLGTNRGNAASPYSVARYYPFGDEISSTSNDRTKFGTYMRDAPTGLDYANQRYYARHLRPLQYPGPANRET